MLFDDCENTVLQTGRVATRGGELHETGDDGVFSEHVSSWITCIGDTIREHENVAGLALVECHLGKGGIHINTQRGTFAACFD